MRTALAVVAAMVAVFAAVVVVRLTFAPKPFTASFELRSQHELSLSEAESQVAIPLERALNGLEGVASVHTHVDAREVTLTVVLKPGVPFDAVVFPAIQKTSEVQTNATPPDIVSTREPMKTMYLAFTSGQLPLPAVDELVEHQVRLELLRTPGYRDVEVCGQSSAVVITVDPTAASAAGLEPLDVLRAIEHADATSTARIDSGAQQFVVRGTGPALDDLRALPLREHVRLDDVARISEEPAGPGCVGYRGGRVVGAVIRLLFDADPAALKRSVASLPAAVSSSPLRVDRTLTVTGVGLDSQLAERVDRVLRLRPDVQDLAVEVTAHGQALIAKAFVELKDPRGPTLLTPPPVLDTIIRLDGEDLRELSVSGPDFDSLQNVAKDVEERLGRLGGYTSTRPPKEATKRIELDRTVMARLSIDASDVTDVLRLSGDEGIVVSTDHSRGSPRSVHVKLPTLEPEGLALIRVGKGVPLATVARFTLTEDPAWIDRDDGQRTIRFQSAASAAQLTEALKDLRLPSGVTLRR